MDWTHELEKSSSQDVLSRAFAPLIPKKSFFGFGGKAKTYVEAPDASVALAAAEVVAALAANPLTDLPENVSAWVARQQRPATELKAAAKAAVEKVLTDSELKDLWEESDEFAAWNSSVNDILRRLS